MKMPDILGHIHKRLKAIMHFFKDPLYQWESPAGFFATDFAKAVSLDKEQRFFTSAFEQELYARYRTVTSRYHRYLITSYILIILLFLSVKGQAIEFTVFGLSIDKIAGIKEIILFLSSTAGCLFAFTAIHHDVLYRCVKKGFASSVPKRFAKLWIARANTSDAISMTLGSYKYTTSRAGSIFLVMLVILMIFVIAYVVVMVSLALYIHIVVILDVMYHSNWSDFWANALVAYVVAVDTVAFVLIFLMTTRLRYVNIELRNELLALDRRSETEFYARIDKLLKESKTTD